MWADLLRRSSELAVLFAAWYLYRWGRQKDVPSSVFGHYERRVNVVLAGIMVGSAIVILVQAWQRWLHPQEVTRVAAGIVLAGLGVIVNGWFWWKHQRYAAETASLLSESQYRLFRSKTILDALVILSLSLTVSLRNQEWAAAIDPLGSLVPALFLIVSAGQILLLNRSFLRKP